MHMTGAPLPLTASPLTASPLPGSSCAATCGSAKGYTPRSCHSVLLSTAGYCGLRTRSAPPLHALDPGTSGTGVVGVERQRPRCPKKRRGNGLVAQKNGEATASLPKKMEGQRPRCPKKWRGNGLVALLPRAHKAAGAGSPPSACGAVQTKNAAGHPPGCVVHTCQRNLFPAQKRHEPD